MFQTGLHKNRKVVTDLASMTMFISGVWEELWPLSLVSAINEKQSLTYDEAIPQKKTVKIPSYLSRETSKGKAHIHKIQARMRCNVRPKN